MLLVTGASGKTGQAICKALADRGQHVRALVRRAVAIPGAEEKVVGDVLAEADVQRAMEGVRAVYHICPNMHPEEQRIGDLVIGAAKAAGVQHFVYHSVLHPQTQGMPHHWNKLKVEEMLFESGVPFIILQPAAYMQNLLAYWPGIVQRGLFAVPYPVETRISLVDLDDVAEAAAIVLTEPGHLGATYELVGTPPLSQADVADLMSQKLNRSVRVQMQTIEEWSARASSLSDYARATLIKMFRYYARYGLVGNPTVLGWLLGRSPTSLDEFILWTARGEAPRSRRPRYCEG
jgi:uncharacterized protein YbjT (DUF2867 family)